MLFLSLFFLFPFFDFALLMVDLMTNGHAEFHKQTNKQTKKDR